MTKTIPTVFSSFSCGSPTDATPSSPCTPSKTRCGASGSSFTSTTIGMGPLKPAPNPSASRSYARRAVCSFGWVPWSEAPRRTRAEVDARGITASSTTGKTIRASFVTKRPQWATRVRSRPASESSTFRRNGTFSRSTLCPSSESTASRSEFAISTVVSTPSALPMPSFVTKSRPMKARPLTEMATVNPAKSTARPADAPASAAASRGESPRARAA